MLIHCNGYKVDKIQVNKMNKLIRYVIMITVRDFRYTDYKLVQELIPEFKNELNYDIDYINIEKNVEMLDVFQ